MYLQSLLQCFSIRLKLVTLTTLRRTSNLVEKKPPLPRMLISGVDRLLDAEDLSWSMVNQNREHLGLSDADATGIKPLFKTGPRDRVTVNWVIEAPPDVFAKLENRTAYLGFSKCRIKAYNRIPQCFNCQSHGHTAARCKANGPTCKNCSGSYESRHPQKQSHSLRYDPEYSLRHLVLLADHCLLPD